MKWLPSKIMNFIWLISHLLSLWREKKGIFKLLELRNIWRPSFIWKMVMDLKWISGLLVSAFILCWLEASLLTAMIKITRGSFKRLGQNVRKDLILKKMLHQQKKVNSFSQTNLYRICSKRSLRLITMKESLFLSLSSILRWEISSGLNACWRNLMNWA